MNAVTFAVWDASNFGMPWIEPLGTHWSGRRLVSVTLNRSQSDGGDLPEIAVSTIDPALPAGDYQGTLTKALLEFAPRLTSAGNMSGREAAETLVQLAQSRGSSTLLAVGNSEVDALRYEVPMTGNWVVVTVDQNHSICVAGDNGVSVPQLELADMAHWSAPLLEQFAEMGSEDQ